jgi:glutaredoxin
VTYRITFLTQQSCHLCDQAKTTLDELNGDFDLTIDEIPIDSPEGRSVAASAGIMFPPGVLIDGTPFSYGRLSARKLRKALSD